MILEEKMSDLFYRTSVMIWVLIFMYLKPHWEFMTAGMRISQWLYIVKFARSLSYAAFDMGSLLCMQSNKEMSGSYSTLKCREQGSKHGPVFCTMT